MTKSARLAAGWLCCALWACGAEGSGRDASPGTARDASGALDAEADAGSAAPDAAPAADARVAEADAAVSSDAGASDVRYMLAVGDCFTFATATSMDAQSMSCGDLLALAGVNVDLTSEDGFCEQGTHRSLATIPTDYSRCAWTFYLEGIEGLADTGLIMRDRAGVHHYRVHIVSNLRPALVFSFAPID